MTPARGDSLASVGISSSSVMKLSPLALTCERSCSCLSKVDGYTPTFPFRTWDVCYKCPVCNSRKQLVSRLTEEECQINALFLVARERILSSESRARESDRARQTTSVERSRRQKEEDERRRHEDEERRQRIEKERNKHTEERRRAGLRREEKREGLLRQNDGQKTKRVGE